MYIFLILYPDDHDLYYQTAIFSRVGIEVDVTSQANQIGGTSRSIASTMQKLVTCPTSSCMVGMVEGDKRTYLQLYFRFYSRLRKM